MSVIRFDYGVLHITSDANASDHIPDWRMLSIDVHGMVGGPFYISHKKFGMTTGRTFLLVLSLLGEILNWVMTDSRITLQDIFRLEGIKNRLGGESKLQFDFPLGAPGVPSILRNSVIDVGIDSGILLNAAHFYEGFGEFYPGLPAFRTRKKIIDDYRTMFKEFKENRTYNGTGTPDKGGHLKSVQGILFRHKEANLTRLSRLSLNVELITSDSAEDHDSFSRVSLLRCPSVLALAVNEIREDEDVNAGFRAALELFVTRGVEATLSRPNNNDEKVQEPSIVVPFVRYGKSLITLDRDEIDGLLSIRFLIENYLAKAKTTTEPLSIAVFGPPGSGKSYVVSEILRSLGKSRPSEKMTFNLSQFTSVKELSQAFHRIQDSALAKEIPVAFFDEFDSPLAEKPLGWLKFFLSPMQDGEYFDGSGVFHVGPAIFVFGGGTASSFRDFVKEYASCKSEKVPDFISRLRGHLDVSDISPTENRVNDRLLVRRALLLRSFLKMKAPNIFDEAGEVANIDRGLVRAFLYVKRYHHGARSLGAIIDMARIGEAVSFQRSALPTLAQLQMHVDGEDFLRCVNEVDAGE